MPRADETAPAFQLAGPAAQAAPRPFPRGCAAAPQGAGLAESRSGWLPQLSVRQPRGFLRPGEHFRYENPGLPDQDQPTAQQCSPRRGLSAILLHASRGCAGHCDQMPEGNDSLEVLAHGGLTLSPLGPWSRKALWWGRGAGAGCSSQKLGSKRKTGTTTRPHLPRLHHLPIATLGPPLTHGLSRTFHIQRRAEI